MESSSRSTLKALPLPKDSTLIELIRTKDTEDIFKYLVNTVITDDRYRQLTGNFAVSLEYVDDDMHNYIALFKHPGVRPSSNVLEAFILGNIDSNVLRINIICGKHSYVHPPLRIQPLIIAKRYQCTHIILSSLVNLIHFYRSVYGFSFERHDLLGREDSCRLIDTGKALDELHQWVISSMDKYIVKTYPSASRKQKIMKQNAASKHVERYMNYYMESQVDSSSKVKCEKFRTKHNLTESYMRMLLKPMLLILLLIQHGYNSVCPDGVPLGLSVPTKRSRRCSFATVHKAMDRLKKLQLNEVNYYGYEMYKGTL